MKHFVTVVLKGAIRINKVIIITAIYKPFFKL